MSLISDFRHAVRALTAHPALTAMAVVMLALGIGSSTAIFSIVNAVLLRPLPFAEGERLVWIWSVDARRSLQQWVSFPDFLDWRDRTRTLEHMAGWGTYELTLTSSAEPQPVHAALVSADFFSLMGAASLLGTTSSQGEQRLVLSYGFWQRHFGGDPALIGRGITLSGRVYTVTGVMPPAFRFPVGSPADLWMVVRDDQFNPALRNRRDARLIEVMARLRPGVTVAQAQADMNAIAENLRRDYPATNADIGVRVVPAIEQVTGKVATVLWVLFGAVGCVLAIACANVANLLLARVVRRRPEIALRAALGASRLRIVRQLTIECLPIAFASGVLGGLLSLWGLHALLSMVPPDLPRATEIEVDLRVLAFAAAVSLASLLTVSLAPAWRASQTNASLLHHVSATASPGRRGRHVLNVLVVVQVAAAMILLSGAALLANSFVRLSQDAPGYDPRNVLTFRLSWPPPTYGPIRAAQAFEALQQRLEALPGVQAASTGLQLPDRGEPLLDNDLPFVEVEGRPIVPSERPRTAVLTVQPHYFHALGIPVVRGRDFDVNDRPGLRPVVVINESLARASFGDEDPVGRRLRIDGWTFLGQRTAEIVGVAGDVKHRHLGANAMPLIYLPLTQNPVTSASVVVKTSGDPLRMVDSVREVVRSMDVDRPIEDIQTLEQRLAASLAQDRFSMWVLGVFAAIAIVLAAGGLYAVLTYAVEQRTQELGIRLALGARAPDVLALVLRDGMRTTGLGIGVGIGGGLAASRAIERLLFGVGATDPLTFTIAALIVGGAGLLACWIPAHRAAKVDPVVTLRGEIRAIQ